jgi:hypothetical protein
MYRFLTNFRWFRKLLGRNWKLLDSFLPNQKPTWYNWDLVQSNPLMMKMIEAGLLTISDSESYE